MATLSCADFRRYLTSESTPDESIQSACLEHIRTCKLCQQATKDHIFDKAKVALTMIDSTIRKVANMRGFTVATPTMDGEGRVIRAIVDDAVNKAASETSYSQAIATAVGLNNDGTINLHMECHCGKQPPCWVNSFTIPHGNAKMIRNSLTEALDQWDAVLKVADGMIGKPK